MNTIIGYGSLMSPLTFVARGLDVDFDPIYEQDTRLFDSYTIKGVRDFWENTNISYYPITITGFKRFYSIKHRGGGMLEVYPDSDASITAALYTDIPDEMFESVVSIEDGYNVSILDSEDIFPYTEDSTVLPKDKTAKLFTPEKDIPNSSLKRHPVYHDRIVESFAFLTEDNLLTTKDTIQFLRDFLETTYEYDSGSWKSLYEVDGNRDIARLKEYMNTGESLYPFE